MRRPILLVDDDQPSLASLAGALRSRFHVHCADATQPFRDALRLWEAHPDVLLAVVDLRMAGGAGPKERAGLELLAKLKGIRPRARVAIRSAYESHENLAAAALAGADGFIGKDWQRDQLLANV